MSQIKKDIYALLRTSAMSKPLAALKGFIVVKFLTPEMYGFLNIITSIQSLSKYGDLGFINVVERDYNYYSVKDKDKAQLVRNIGYSSEIIFSIILSLIIAIISFFYMDENFVIFFGILCSAVLFLLSKFLNIYYVHMRITKQFQRMAKYSLYTSLVINISIAITVPFIGIYSPLVIGMFASSIVLFFIYKNVVLNFSFDFKLDEFKRQFRAGLVLGGLTLVYGVSMYVERIIVVDFFDLKMMGYVAFILVIISFAQYFIFDAVRPYIPRTKEEIGGGNYDILYANAIKPTLIMIPIVFLGIIASNFLMPILIEFALEQYIEAIFLLKMMMFSLYFITVSAFFGYLLVSPGIEKTVIAYVSHILYILVFGFVFYIFKDEGMICIAISFVVASAVRSLVQTITILRFVLDWWKILLVSVIGYVIPLTGILWIVFK